MVCWAWLTVPLQDARDGPTAMKLAEAASPEKLRGGFYTPRALVSACYDRLQALLGSRRRVSILEPSAGDGVFIRGLDHAHPIPLAGEIDLTCVELDPAEAAKCRRVLQESPHDGRVVTGSFFRWACDADASFDAVVGNPPFVRYQYVPKAERRLAERLVAGLGRSLDGVSNLWIPLTLISLERLRGGGAFALVLPGEFLSTRSGRLIRSSLIRNFDSIQVDFFPRDSFPDLLQTVTVVSGARDPTARDSRAVTFCERGSGPPRAWSRRIPDSEDSWTRFLITGAEWDAFRAAGRIQEMHLLGEIALLSVSIVTGANPFFTVTEEVKEEYGLGPWARPLLARTADCPGIVFTREDHQRVVANGRTGWILDFSADRPDPAGPSAPRRYLQVGKSRGLHQRYKCRIRAPWYRVPNVRRGALLLSKRAHRFHRLILNGAEVFTTDTVYRGDVRAGLKRRRRDLVAGFHNSLTLLSAELEGRSYGGGVLELVPSEIARLVIPLVEMDPHLAHLDRVCRDAGGQLDRDETLIRATDAVLCTFTPELKTLLPNLRSARARLRRRRFLGQDPANPPESGRPAAALQGVQTGPHHEHD